MTAPLTPRQAALLDAIRTWHANAGFPPTARELGRMVGISSTSVVIHNLKRLEARGLIRRTEGMARSIVLVEQEAVPAHVKRTLLAALQTEEEEYGRTADTSDARLWLEGKLPHAPA